jgi:hypothetical protein
MGRWLAAYRASQRSRAGVRWNGSHPAWDLARAASCSRLRTGGSLPHDSTQGLNDCDLGLQYEPAAHAAQECTKDEPRAHDPKQDPQASLQPPGGRRVPGPVYLVGAAVDLERGAVPSRAGRRVHVDLRDMEEFIEKNKVRENVARQGNA